MIARVYICLVLVLTCLTVFSIESVESKPSIYKCRPGAMYCNRKNGKRSYVGKQVGVQIN